MRLRNLFCLIIIIIIRYRDVLDFQNLKMAAVRHLEILRLTFGSRHFMRSLSDQRAKVHEDHSYHCKHSAIDFRVFLVKCKNSLYDRPLLALRCQRSHKIL